MKKLFNFLLLFAVIMTIVSLTSCNKAAPGPGQEVVYTYQPWIFGEGYTDTVPGETGLHWGVPSTRLDYFTLTPVSHEVTLEDLSSDDNTPLDFHTVVITRIKKGRSPFLLMNYGVDSLWFKTNIEKYYGRLVRNQVSNHNPFELMSDEKVLNKIDSTVRESLQAYIDHLSITKGEFPVEIQEVVIGKAIPNQKQLDEMNNTAKAVQGKQTQEREREMQLKRGDAEAAHGEADARYMRASGLSPEQFVRLRVAELYSKSAGTIIVDGSGSSKTISTGGK